MDSMFARCFLFSRGSEIRCVCPASNSPLLPANGLSRYNFIELDINIESEKFMVRQQLKGLIALFGIGTSLAFAQDLRIAKIGVCPLVNGQKIDDCRLGYRTVGTLSKDKSNVIVFPSWAGGTSEHAMQLVAATHLIDTSKYFVIFVHAFSNGVSSSPSNSPTQAGMAFPGISIADMVNATHTLVTKELGINHVHAVMGQSMGGMQTFQWIVAYPEFMDKAVPIVGSPRLATFDLLVWKTTIDGIKQNPAWNGGNYKTNPVGRLQAELGWFTLWTPDFVNKMVPRNGLDAAIENGMKGARMDANDSIRQAEGMMALDVSQAFGGSMDEAAKHVKAKVLVVVGKYDHTVTPGPAIEFAKQIGAQTMVLDSDCGHMVLSCKADEIVKAVTQFLE